MIPKGLKDVLHGVRCKEVREIVCGVFNTTTSHAEALRLAKSLNVNLAEQLVGIPGLDKWISQNAFRLPQDVQYYLNNKRAAGRLRERRSPLGSSMGDMVLRGGSTHYASRTFEGAFEHRRD